MINVVSTTLYGGDRRYSKGALYNTRLCKEFFPDWEFRVYHEDGFIDSILEELQNEGAKLINVGKTTIVPSMWRFHVYDDPNVNYFISRDLDDRLNRHDAELVQEWIESGHPFHIIRSHPGHRNEVLAGMWGGKAKYFENFDMGKEMNNFKYGNRGKEEDQNFLRDIFYPKIRNLSLVHGYDFYKSPFVRKFPKKILNLEGEETYPMGEVYELMDERSKFE
jgi:hypothetical protein